jgi:hypothetical protein
LQFIIFALTKLWIFDEKTVLVYRHQRLLLEPQVEEKKDNAGAVAVLASLREVGWEMGDGGSGKNGS